MPESKLLRASGLMEGIIQELMFGASDESDEGVYHDFSIEPEPDDGGDEDEEGQHEGKEEGNDPAR